MDLNRLTLSDKIIAASGILLLLFSFMPWFGVNGYSGGGNAWDVGLFTGILPVLLGLLMVAYVAVRAFAPDTKMPDLPIPYALLLLILGGLAALLILLRLLIGYKVGLGAAGSVKLDRKYGIFLALLASLGLVAGAAMAYMAEQKGGSTTTRGSGNTPPTPF